MKRYYRLIVPSFVDVFCRVNADEVFTFNFESQDSASIISQIESDDMLIVLSPVNDVINGYVLRVVSADNGIEVVKADELTADKFDISFSKEFEEITNQDYDALMSKMIDGSVPGDNDDDAVSDDEITKNRVQGADNILLYGVPGCGKSYRIKSKYCSDDNFMERVVFHPDYTYSDFVGQILPSTDGEKISYPFVPGPFTRILSKAYDDCNNPYYLVIEEINRGNAPAIFGDVFQLLDRIDDPADGPLGESKYGITNSDIANEVYKDKDHKVKLPSNLYILATMNTSDQNVFTLDNAFQRRWSMQIIPNDIRACKYADDFICDTSVTWADFAIKINDKIIESGAGSLSSEDNRLGAYFVKRSELRDTSKFAEKVLMYLWNYVFRFESDKEKVFKKEYKTLENLIEGFKKYKFDVFLDEYGFDSTPQSVSGEDVPPNENDDDNSVTVDDYLSDKSPILVDLFNALFEAVKNKIPDAYAYAVNSLTYIGLSAENLARRNFADVSVNRDKIQISTEPPITEELKDIGNMRDYIGHHNHYFNIELSDVSMLDSVVQVIVESYNQLKKW